MYMRKRRAGPLFPGLQKLPSVQGVEHAHPPVCEGGRGGRGRGATESVVGG